MASLRRVVEHIENIVDDDFSEDINIRLAQGHLRGEKRIMAEKLSEIYRVAHSHVRSHICFEKHTEWRKLVPKKPR